MQVRKDEEESKPGWAGPGKLGLGAKTDQTG